MPVLPEKPKREAIRSHIAELEGLAEYVLAYVFKLVTDNPDIDKERAKINVVNYFAGLVSPDSAGTLFDDVMRQLTGSEIFQS